MTGQEILDEYFSKDTKKKFINNLEKHGDKNTLNKEHKSKQEQVTFIKGAFLWDNTKEGLIYWGEMTDHIKEHIENNHGERKYISSTDEEKTDVEYITRVLRKYGKKIWWVSMIPIVSIVIVGRTLLGINEVSEAWRSFELSLLGIQVLALLIVLSRTSDVFYNNGK